MESEEMRFNANLEFPVTLDQENECTSFIDSTIISDNGNMLLPESSDDESAEMSSQNSKIWGENHNLKHLSQYLSPDTFNVTSIATESSIEAESDSTIISSPRSFSSYSPGNCSSPEACSPKLISLIDCLNSMSLQTACGMRDLTFKSPVTSPDSGIADVDDLAYKTNSSTDGSTGDEEQFENSIDSDKSIGTDEEYSFPTEIVEIFTRGDTEFWYSSDDSDDGKISCCEFQYNELLMSGNSVLKNTGKKRQRQKRKVRHKMVENQSDWNEMKKEDTTNVKLISCKWSPHSAYKNAKTFEKNSIGKGNQHYDQWYSREEKRRLTRKKKKEKRKVKILLNKTLDSEYPFHAFI